MATRTVIPYYFPDKPVTVQTFMMNNKEWLDIGEGEFQLFSEFEAGLTKELPHWTDAERFAAEAAYASVSEGRSIGVDEYAGVVSAEVAVHQQKARLSAIGDIIPEEEAALYAQPPAKSVGEVQLPTWYIEKKALEEGFTTAGVPGALVAEAIGAGAAWLTGQVAGAGFWGGLAAGAIGMATPYVIDWAIEQTTGGEGIDLPFEGSQAGGQVMSNGGNGGTTSLVPQIGGIPLVGPGVKEPPAYMVEKQWATYHGPGGNIKVEHYLVNTGRGKKILHITVTGPNAGRYKVSTITKPAVITKKLPSHRTIVRLRNYLKRHKDDARTILQITSPGLLKTPGSGLTHKRQRRR